MLFVLETKQMPGSQRLGDTAREGEGEGERGKEKGEWCWGDGRTEERVWEGPAGAQSAAGAEGRGDRREGNQSEISRDSQLKDPDGGSETQVLGEGGERAWSSCMPAG